MSTLQVLSQQRLAMFPQVVKGLRNQQGADVESQRTVPLTARLAGQKCEKSPLGKQSLLKFGLNTRLGGKVTKHRNSKSFKRNVAIIESDSDSDAPLSELKSGQSLSQTSTQSVAKHFTTVIKNTAY